MSQEKIVSIRVSIKEGFMETRAEDGSGLRVDLATGEVLQQIPFGKDGAGEICEAGEV